MLDVSWPLREEQPIELRSLLDQTPELLPPDIKVATRLKHIRHGRAEDACANSGPLSLFIPTQWLAPMMLTEKAPWCFPAPELHADAPRPGFRVTMRTCRRQLHAAPPGIESVMSPFNTGIEMDEVVADLNLRIAQTSQSQIYADTTEVLESIRGRLDRAG